jgi:MoaA/NifB/PqqE/SkfB family radical SAM enzyme
LNFRALLNTVASTAYSLPLAILYVTEGCNMQCITCSFRDALPGELSLAEMSDLAQALASVGVRHIVYSGGEPLLRRDFPEICRVFSSTVPRQSLLTNGLLLEKRLVQIRPHIAEVTVSVDGPDAATHDRIRGLSSFDQVVRGIRAAVGRLPRIMIRTVVQKENFRRLADMVRLAQSLGVGGISFLAADIHSAAFGRSANASAAHQQEILLTVEEAQELREVVERLMVEHRNLIESGFIRPSARSLYHIVEYYEASISGRPFPPVACNAPMVSLVITSTGNVRPCYFLPEFGNVRTSPMADLLNADSIQSVRKEVRGRTREECRKCVCRLNVHPIAALMERW